MFAKLKSMVMSTVASSASRNILSGIDAAIVRSTDYTDACPEDKHTHQILFLISNSPGSITYFCRRASNRLGSSRDPLVALKTLFLLHRLIRGGDRYFEQDLHKLWASGDLKLDLKWLLKSRNINHNTLSIFVLNYSYVVEERMGWSINQGGKLEPIVRASKEEGDAALVVNGMSKCMRLLDRVAECLVIEDSRSNNVMQCVMNVVLRESFHVYESLCEGVDFVSGSLFDLKKDAQVLALDTLRQACVSTSKLSEFYDKCKRCVLNKSLRYPAVKIITGDDISMLEAKIVTQKEIPCPFSQRLESKISSVWVEFGEDDLQRSSFHVEDGSCSQKWEKFDML